jgi:hypothetical protein
MSTSLPKLKLQDLKKKPNFKIWPEPSDDFKFETLDDTGDNEHVVYGDFDNLTPDDVMDLNSKTFSGNLNGDYDSKNPDPYGHSYDSQLNRLNTLNPQDFNDMNRLIKGASSFPNKTRYTNSNPNPHSRQRLNKVKKYHPSSFEGGDEYKNSLRDEDLMRRELQKLGGNPQHHSYFHNNTRQRIKDRIKHFDKFSLPDDEDKLVANNNLLGK